MRAKEKWIGENCNTEYAIRRESYTISSGQSEVPLH